MAMLIAALCADGRSEIGNIGQIDRGYERIDERLRDARRAHRAGRERSRAGSRVSAAEPPPSTRDRPVTLRIPSGTRDVLPEEMRALRAHHERAARDLRRVRLRRDLDAGGRVRGDAARSPTSGLKPSYRVVDDHGALLALRADMTVPIARVVATRYADAEPPLRFCYAAHAYRAVRPHRGQMREFLQAGVELVGAPGAAGHRRGR